MKHLNYMVVGLFAAILATPIIVVLFLACAVALVYHLGKEMCRK